MNKKNSQLRYLDDPTLSSKELLDILFNCEFISVFKKALYHPNLEVPELVVSVDNSLRNMDILWQDIKIYKEYPKLPKFLRDYIKIYYYVNDL